MHGTPSTSIRASPSCRSSTAVTAPRRRLSGTRLLEQGQGDVDHALQVGDGDVLLRCVDLGHAVREVEAGEPADVEDVRVGAAAGQRIRGFAPDAPKRRVGEPYRLVT